MTTYVFPGQGAQKLGMGKELFDAYPDLIAQADEIIGTSLKRLCLEDPDNVLNLTQYTQPALFAVNALTYLQRMATSDKEPNYLAGHSLGEFNALFAAGAFDFATGLKLVCKRGELMAAAGAGGMAAVMNIGLKDIERILAENGLGAIDVANFNAPSQIVVSGPKDEIERAIGPFEDAGARYVIIKVNSAFHSRYMKPSRDAFAAFLTQFNFDPLSIPVISNVRARPYRSDEVKTLLANQINNSVNWVDSIRYLMGKGETEFIECGPGKVLTGLIRKIVQESDPLHEADEPLLEVHEEAPVAPPATPLAPPPQAYQGVRGIDPKSLGSQAFREAHGTKYAYMASAIEHGVSSVETVLALGKASLLGFYGAGGQSLERIDSDLERLHSRLCHGEPFGVGVLSQISRPEHEAQVLALCLRYGVRVVEAANYLQLTPSLVAYRLKGLHRDERGRLVAPNRIIARISRPEIAQLFMSPPPAALVSRLREAGAISALEASLAQELPMAHDILAMADCGGLTEQALAYVLIPTILRLRDEMQAAHNYAVPIRVGAAGGIGTPEAAAAAFVLGADFIATNSINQATLEAGTSPLVKDMLVEANIQDTAYAPSGDLFEMGARVQVLKRGLFFPARANKLYSLYQHFASLDEIDAKSRQLVQEKYFRRDFDEVWRIQSQLLRPDEREKAERNPKYKMLLVFKWYFDYTWSLALEGRPEHKVDFQVFCGSSLGAFNQWVKGTSWHLNWQTRQVDLIADKLMIDTAAVLALRLVTFQPTPG